MRSDVLRISEDKASRLTAFITGCTVALGTTTLFFSLTSNVRSGYELAFADFLLPVALFTGYRFRLLNFPSPTAVLLAAAVLLSSVSLLSAYSAISFSAVILSLSSLRGPIARHKKEFYVPLLIIVGLGLPVAIFWQALVLHHYRPWGLHGAANPAGEIAAFVTLLSTGPMILVPMLMLGLTGSRAGLLGLAAGALMLGRAKLRLILVILLGELVLLLLITGVTAAIGKENILGSAPDETSLYLPKAQPLSRLYPAEILEELSTGARIDQARHSLGTTRLLPNGFRAGTEYEETNPHNIYLILWNGLGWGLGSIAIASLGYLLVRSREPLLACILAAGLFDHVWVTTSIGLYPLGAAMGLASVRIEGRQARNAKARVWQLA